VKNKISTKERKIQEALGTLPTDKCELCQIEVPKDELKRTRIHYGRMTGYYYICKECRED